MSLYSPDRAWDEDNKRRMAKLAELQARERNKAMGGGGVTDEEGEDDDDEEDDEEADEHDDDRGSRGSGEIFQFSSFPFSLFSLFCLLFPFFHFSISQEPNHRKILRFAREIEESTRRLGIFNSW